MGIFVKDLYTDRKGKNEAKVIDIFGKPVLDRLFKIMRLYDTVEDYSIMDSYKKDIKGPFLEKLYYHLFDESVEEKSVNLSFNHYERFVVKTILSKFFDSLELYCYELSLAVNEANHYSPYRRRDELEGFMINVNELLMRNGVPYQLKKNSEGRILMTTISDSKVIQKKIKEIIVLTSNKEFKGIDNTFIEAENCFAKRDYDEVLKKCNYIIETILCTLLSKGSGHINDLMPEFLKKFEVPRALNNSISKLVETIQHTRSSYIKEIHGKNKNIDKEDVSDILEEICEFILGETAVVGIFIVKTYKKLK